MKVVIFEPAHTGHRFEYLALVIPAICELGADVTVVSSPIGFESEEFQTHLAGLEHSFSKYECRNITRTSVVARMIATAGELSAAIRRVQPDHVYVPGADGFSQVLGMRQLIGGNRLFRDVFVEGIHFRGAYGYRLDRPHRRVKSVLDGMLVTHAPFSVFYHLDPWQLYALCRRYPGLRTRSAVMPDPVKPPLRLTKSEARKELGIPSRGTYLGCAGPISYRKGGDLLLAAFAAASSLLPVDARLLLAGRFEYGVRKMLDSDFGRLVAEGRIVVIDRHLSLREMDIVVPAMDIVTTPYRDHLTSSGILLRAAACGRPILASNRHWMNNVVTTFNLGATCNVLDRGVFVTAIIRAFEQFRNFKQPGSAQRFLQFQSEENFLATWTSHLRGRLGLAPNPTQLTWDWVMGANANWHTGQAEKNAM